MPDPVEQTVRGDTYRLYRRKSKHNVQYWCRVYVFFGDDAREIAMIRIRTTKNAAHPEWEEIPLEFAADGGYMPYETFMELYEEVPRVGV